MKKRINFFHIILLIAVIALLIKAFSSFYVNYIWFKDLGYSQLFTTPIVAKLLIGAVSFVIYFTLFFGMTFVAFKTYQKAEQERPVFWKRFFESQTPPEEIDITPTNKKRITYIILFICILISFFLAFQTTGNGWMKLLEFTNSSIFGITEPVFHKDISFYVFKMPFYNFVLNSLFSSLLVIFLASLFLFSISGLIKIRGNIFRKGSIVFPQSIRKFSSGLICILFILFGLKKILSMYTILYSQTGYVYGASYTDIHVTIPLSIILAAMAFLCGSAALYYFFVNDHRFMIKSLIGYFIVSFLGIFAHSFVQYTVSNNEFIKEKPYIEQEIKFTCMAYQLNNLQIKDYPGTTPITLDKIKNNQDTIKNIRLNDPKPLKTVLSQNQGLRYYYQFHDIDIDRYKIDGEYRQVLLGPREISEKSLTEKALTFVNMTMKYTHGYGLTGSLANEIDESGYARLIVKDIPPQSAVKGINIKEPRIYFGELTKDERYGYVIGNTAAKEFDYPLGDTNMENTYQGSTGLSFSPLNKLFLSAYYNTFRFYIAREIQPNSKLLMRRNIVDRVKHLMPYLKYDRDPYIVAAQDSKLYWILDAYSFTQKFPYSAPSEDLNYIRNSVKVVIDAYNGSVNFYAFDQNDPILKTISKIFPGVFKNISDMPSNLREHIRYPEDYFTIQSHILRNFHVSNPSVFYNREDTWDIAKKVEENSTVTMEPYYTIMKLPEEKNSEFVLILPFTPASRQDQHRNNMVAWLAARNDGANYGELILYKMPKNVEIQGPLMIDSLIDQNTTISQKLTLWGQGGSQVIRGNQLVVPIDGGFIYVEPIYIKAEKQGTSIPQMQAIVFAIDKKLILVETKSLDTAIAQFFGKEGLEEKPLGEPNGPKVLKPKESILEKIEILKRQLMELEKDVKSM
ncbi:MAG: UPF0182 family protein [Bacillota bacterium]